ncbi:MAG TPA: amidohydrolase family protein [Phycisphaerales bacterium]|nr:amidohydrolase family protein [Phycisphaerales bacterium]
MPVLQRSNPSNLFAWDYEKLASSFAQWPYPIVDVHSHINGKEASRLYARVAKLYGVGLTYSMTQFQHVSWVRDALGDRVRFIAVPDWMDPDRKHAHGRGFLQRIEQFHELGSRVCKFWAAPRGIDLGIQSGDPAMLTLDSPQRLEAMKLAASLGMIFMTHVSDPNTWFATKYADAKTYGTKLDQYKPLEKLLDQFTQPWIAAHMGGWPEDLDFLSKLLSRHANLYLDASACKWMVREVSVHTPAERIEFLTRFQGRVLFGSDIVTVDEHLMPAKEKTEMAAKADTPEDAFDLYASRYWALRTLWETDFVGLSPIADPDLHMVDPKKYAADASPMLRGVRLPAHLLKSLYFDAADALLETLHVRPI